jgi:hypothetical protein
MREHFEYVHDLLFQQQHEIYVTTHQRRPTDKQHLGNVSIQLRESLYLLIF